MTNRTKTVKLALALMLSASVGTLAIAAPASAQEAANFQRFANSGYTYCDAKLVGALYGQNPYQGKLLIGLKLVDGIGDDIPYMLQQSRNQGYSCDWNDLDLSYDDAEVLGEYWGVSAWQAKAKAAYFYTNGQSYLVDDALN